MMQLYLSRKRSILFAIGLSFLVGVFLLFALGYYLVSPAKKGGHDQLFLVRDGSTLKEVVGELNTREIITSKRLFLLWARLMGYSTNIKAGEYLLNSGMPPLKILNILSKGTILTHPVTIPEGFTRKQIGEILEKRGLTNKQEFLSLTGNPDIAKRYGISGPGLEGYGPGLEGYLYPDTYQFGRGLPTMSVIDAMVKRFREVVAPFRKRAEQLDMAIEKVVILASIVEKETGRAEERPLIASVFIEKVVILASIVEKETGRAEERPLIASVFLNRLKKRMRLESDPTVIYGLKEFDGNLTRKHLGQNTPYNTYVIRGLPPGPISNPGREAIKAVLYPADTAYLYFVSKNDGSHYFSETLSEHNKAVEIYQKKKRRSRGKTS
jgi:UPF0755 protein